MISALKSLPNLREGELDLDQYGWHHGGQQENDGRGFQTGLSRLTTTSMVLDQHRVVCELLGPAFNISLHGGAKFEQGPETHNLKNKKGKIRRTSWKNHED